MSRQAFTMGEGIGVTFLDLWRAEFHAGPGSMSGR